MKGITFPIKKCEVLDCRNFPPNCNFRHIAAISGAVGLVITHFVIMPMVCYSMSMILRGVAWALQPRVHVD